MPKAVETRAGKDVYFKITEEDVALLLEAQDFFGLNQTGALRAGIRALVREKRAVEEMRRRGVAALRGQA